MGSAGQIKMRVAGDLAGFVSGGVGCLLLELRRLVEAGHDADDLGIVVMTGLP